MWLFPEYIEVAEPNTKFSGKKYDLAEEGMSVTVEPHILDVIKSNSQEPYKKIDTGSNIEIEAVLQGANIIPEADQQITGRIKRDVHYKVKKPRSEQHWFLSNVFMLKNYDKSFTNDGVEYIPLKVTSSSASVLQILRLVKIEGEDPAMSPENYDLETESGEVIYGYEPIT